jgi:hypothetical protein
MRPDGPARCMASVVHGHVPDQLPSRCRGAPTRRITRCRDLPLAALGGFAHPRIRYLEIELPDTVEDR